MRSVLGKHRECTDPVRAGFLEYAAGAVARGATCQREGGRESRLSGMEWFRGGVEWGEGREEVEGSGLFRLVTGWVI